MNIAFCFDDNYVMPYLVCMVSILENNKSEKISFYLITTGLKDENIKKFTKMADIYGQKVFVKIISSDLYNELPYDKKYSYATYNRFMIPKVVDVSKILYLDGDIIVRKNLSELWNTNLDDFACAVVEDQRADDIIIHNRLKIDSTYFNSGVQLMNLDYWRKNDIGKMLIQFLRDFPERCLYMDQDAANAKLEGKLLFLDYKYNVQEDWFLPPSRYLIHYSKWEKVFNAIKEPAIVHFCRELKPWYKECVHPYKSEFVQYASMYDFIGYKELDYKKNTHSLAYRLVYPFFYFFSGVLSRLK